MGFEGSHNDTTEAPLRTIRVNHFGGHRVASAITVVLVTGGILAAPSAAASFTDNLADGVLQMRAGTSCGPLQHEPVVEQTAAIVTRSTDSYLNHTARAVPVADPLPILKDLGFNAGKAQLLQGAGKTEADAIEFILISGYQYISDCSYAQYGVSTLPNDNLGGYFLTALVLAGP